MKKILGVLVVFMFCISGCTSEYMVNNDPADVLNSVIQERYKGGVALIQKVDGDFYVSLVEEESRISLVMLEKKGDSYEYFGGSSYNKTDRAGYGTFVYGDDKT